MNTKQRETKYQKFIELHVFDTKLCRPNYSPAVLMIVATPFVSYETNIPIAFIAMAVASC